MSSDMRLLNGQKAACLSSRKTEDTFLMVSSWWAFYYTVRFRKKSAFLLTNLTQKERHSVFLQLTINGFRLLSKSADTVFQHAAQTRVITRVRFPAAVRGQRECVCVLPLWRGLWVWIGTTAGSGLQPGAAGASGPSSSSWSSLWQPTKCTSTSYFTH